MLLASLLLTLGQILSKGLGLLREITLAGSFGAGNEMDAFLVAVSTITVCTAGLASGLQAAVVPIFSGLIAKYGQREAHKRFAPVFVAVFLFLCCLTGLVVVFGPYLVKIVAPGFKGGQSSTALMLLRLNSPLALLTGLVSVATGLLIAQKSYGYVALSGIPYNLAYLGVLMLVLHSSSGILAVSAPILTATTIQVIYLYYALARTGFRVHASVELNNPEIVRLGNLVLPVFLGSIASQLNVLADSSMASVLRTGSISALAFASRIRDIPQTILVASLSSAIFPVMSRAVAEEDPVGANSALERGLKAAIAVCVPISTFMALFSLELTTAIFKRGRFDDMAVALTASTIVCYGVGLVPYAIKDMFEKAFYSRGNTKIPTLIAVLSLVLNVVLNIIFRRYLGVAGLALATSVATTINAVILYKLHSSKVRGFSSTALLRTMLKSCLASVPAAAITYGFSLFLGGLGSIITLASCIASFSIIHVGISLLVHEEVTISLVSRATRMVSNLVRSAA